MTDIGRAGTYRLGDREVNRMGYGAMRLTGPGIYGPPKDRDEAIAVLREAVASGVNHIDTSDYYGPHVINEIIREALSPYPDDLVIVTKLGARRDPTRRGIPAMSPEELRSRSAGQSAPPRPRGDGGGQFALHGLRPWTVRGLDRGASSRCWRSCSARVSFATSG